MGGDTSLESPKCQNCQFSSDRADFWCAGIFLPHLNTEPLSFGNFNLKVGKMGGATSLRSPKFQNRQFSSNRADFWGAGIFLSHLNTEPLSFRNFKK